MSIDTAVDSARMARAKSFIDKALRDESFIDKLLKPEQPSESYPGMKSTVGGMKDPRANVLFSLKPYLIEVVYGPGEWYAVAPRGQCESYNGPFRNDMAGPSLLGFVYPHTENWGINPYATHNHKATTAHEGHNWHGHMDQFWRRGNPWDQEGKVRRGQHQVGYDQG